MLDEAEWEELMRHHDLTGGTDGARTSLRERFVPVLNAYERLTGFRETNPSAIWHHRLALFGPDCRACGKPLRSPLARLCASCGALVGAQAVADPAIPSESGRAVASETSEEAADSFDIDFEEEWAVDDDGWVHAVGEITLGEHRERFLSDLSRVTVAEYRDQWQRGMQRLVDGATFSAVWTSFPSQRDGQGFAWVFYRNAMVVHVQERLVVGPPTTEASDWSLESPWLDLDSARHTTSEGGLHVSEWLLTVKAVQEYVGRDAT